MTQNHFPASRRFVGHLERLIYMIPKRIRNLFPPQKKGTKTVAIYFLHKTSLNFLFLRNIFFFCASTSVQRISLFGNPQVLTPKYLWKEKYRHGGQKYSNLVQHLIDIMYARHQTC